MKRRWLIVGALAVLVAIVLGLAVRFLSSNWQGGYSLIHVHFPSEFTYLGDSQISGSGHASISAKQGTLTLLFKKDGKLHAAVLDSSGGEIYLTLDEADIHLVIEAVEGSGE